MAATPALAAISGPRAGAVVFALVLLVVFVGGAAYAAYRRPRRPGTPDIPPAMKPGPTDADLERPRLEKMIAWGAVLVLFMAIWVPIVWLREPAANSQDLATQHEISIQRGSQLVELATKENPTGFGCVRCHGADLTSGYNVFNGNVVRPPDLTTVCAGPNANPAHPQIHSLGDVINTIAQGRAGTDMPSWSVRFAGPLDDDQIQDIVNYLLSIQQKIPDKKNVCLHPTAP